jgi:hypothetical protein
LKILDFKLTEAAIKVASLKDHPLIPSPLGERVRVRGRRCFLKDFGSSDLWSERFSPAEGRGFSA